MPYFFASSEEQLREAFFLADAEAANKIWTLLNWATPEVCTSIVEVDFSLKLIRRGEVCRRENCHCVGAWWHDYAKRDFSIKLVSPNIDLNKLVVQPLSKEAILHLHALWSTREK